MKAKELKALDPVELFKKWYLEAEKLEPNNLLNLLIKT